MRPRTIIGFAALVGFSALLLFNFGEQVSGYVDFAEAERTGVNAHVIGMWVEGKRQAYDPDQNLFSFYMVDEQGNERRVHYYNPKPANFEDAERLVIEGHSEDAHFVAENILVKCPSKYSEQRAAEQLNNMGTM